MLLKQLIHNGIVIISSPTPRQLVLTVRGEPVTLTAKQEEMALAWAKKQGTEYVEDPVFVENFLSDFSTALGIQPPLTLDEVDFGPANNVILAQKAAKEALTKEEKKILSAQRKREREALQARYGYAIVNGQLVELAGYVVEPSGIFMGRGRHPLRGRWKEGATRRDVTLNLSPDAPHPPGDWKEIVWEPEALWVARWRDKLSGKLKYIWLSDSAPIKQKREAEKFDQAIELHLQLDQVREHIETGLTDENPRVKMVATACYLIDALCLRVGDEKDEDEADTVGATTLRPEHITLHPDGSAEFRFLGKDSVLLHKRIPVPEVVHDNLVELIKNACPSDSDSKNGDKPQVFPLIGSRDVNDFLSEALPGLTAKVFRTHHASEVVQQSLAEAEVAVDDPEYKKWEAATQANLAAAVLCNHSKKIPARWPERLERMKEREKTLEERLAQREADLQERQETLEMLRQEASEKLEACTTEKQQERTEKSYEKKIARAQRRIDTAQRRLDKAQAALGKHRARMSVNTDKRAWNLGTSLKSYIDPRVYYRWGQEVDYDILERYYPKALRRKFGWVKENEIDSAEDWGEFD